MLLRRIAAATVAVAAFATAATAVNAAAAKKPAAAKPAAAAGPAAAGKKVFENQCSLCHSIAPGEGGEQGPELNGVVGRKVASVAGFSYSKALKAKTNTWTQANLDIFLTDPQKFAPGTSMPINVPDAKDRAAVIAFLATTK